MYRCHQKGSFPQTPLLYVLSFLKRKYERKQFGKCPETLLKVQGGAILPCQLYQSKGGSAARILKCFLIVRGFAPAGTGGKSFLPLSWGVNDVGEKFTSVRSNIAGFTEKRVGGAACHAGEGSNQKGAGNCPFDDNIKFVQTNY